MAEEIVLVDLFDRETGYGEKLKVHRERKLHRAFSLFVTDEEGNLLLQKRAEGKYHSGGLWTNACCSHQPRGETLEEAVVRRTREELGIEVVPKELFSFLYFRDFGDLAEYELDHVFLAVYRGNRGDIHPDAGEIGDLQWIRPGDLKQRLEEEPSIFTAWFLTAAPVVLRMLMQGEKQC